MNNCITLRPHLIGALNDIVESASIGALGKSSIVSEIVSLFVDYQEEGASLFLDAFLINKLDQLMAMIPQSYRLRLGNVPCNESGIRVAVKKTAPLVRGCWKMYLSPGETGIEFGLFRDSGHPLNVPIDLTLQSDDVGDVKFIRITRLARYSIRVSIHDGKQIIIHFTNDKEGADVSSQPLSTLCDIICSGLEEKLSQSCKTYLSSLLSKAVRESHGSLIAVANTMRVPKFLADCTMLNPPLDLSEAVETLRRDFASIPQLYALESIILGIFCCDGIVVFDTKAKVIAYNAFIKPKPPTAAGGARMRAYQALCNKVGKGLKAAFFQSQDGASDLRRIKNE